MAMQFRKIILIKNYNFFIWKFIIETMTVRHKIRIPSENSNKKLNRNFELNDKLFIFWRDGEENPNLKLIKIK